MDVPAKEKHRRLDHPAHLPTIDIGTQNPPTPFCARANMTVAPNVALIGQAMWLSGSTPQVDPLGKITPWTASSSKSVALLEMNRLCPGQTMTKLRLRSR